MMDRRKIKEYATTPFNRHLVLELLSEYKRPNDKISEMIKSGELISVRRGLYVVGPALDLPRPESFLIANHLRGPSYVTMESALEYWGLIPEHTFEVVSATLKTSKRYDTEVGRFTYRQLQLPYYAYGVRSVELAPDQVALVASAEKALCDMIVLTPNIHLRSVRQTKDYLLEDLRLDEERLSELNTGIMQTWLEQAPKRSSLEMLLKTMEQL